MESISQELRQAVLQAAIQGKLTKQLPEDGNARDLLKQIKNEKERLIKEKKIKKEKPLPEITPDEVPFDIPENWQWCNFTFLFTVYNGDRGKNYPSKVTLQTTGSIPFISAINLNGKDVSVDDKLLYLSNAQYDNLRAGHLMKNDMVMCIRGSLGKHGRFQFDKGAIASSLVIIRPIDENSVISDYLAMYLDSPLLFSEIKRFDNGTAQPNLAAESLRKFMFPLPPFAEQKRIVARAEELMAKIDELEVIENNLRELHQAFPNDMKAALLHAAMQGKLTEQLPEDGNASDLLKQINAEKDALIKQKKIKKEKKSPPITEDEVPFDIPDNWEWCRLKDISVISAGGTPSRSEPKYWNGNIPWIKIGDMSSKFVSKADEFITEEGLNNSSAKWVEKGTILYSIFASIGTVSILDFRATTNQAIASVSLTKYLNRDYIYYVLVGLKRIIVGRRHGMAQFNINQDILKSALIPVPPLAEQERIVEKLDRLLPLCDSLQTEL